MKSTPLAPWRIRPDGAAGNGHALPVGRLAEGIEHGLWTELDQVYDPRTRQWQPIGEHEQLSEHLPPQQYAWREGEEDEQTDMTPMIDVTFQLVIFFMITASFTIQKTLDMPVPDTDPKPSAVKQLEDLQRENVVVTIAADGAIQIDGKATPTNQLVDALGEAIENKGSSELILDVADEAVHDVVVRVMDAAGAAKVEKVLFVSRVKTGSPEVRGPP